MKRRRGEDFREGSLRKRSTLNDLSTIFNNWATSLRNLKKEKRDTQVQAKDEAADLTRLLNNDSVIFINEMRRTLRNEKQKLGKFLQIMLDFHHKRVQENTVIEIVKKLFEEHNNLIRRFNAFLPEKDKITPRDDGLSKDADKFINIVCKRLENGHKHIYGSFLQTLIKLKRCNKISVIELYYEVGALLTGHQDLLLQFYEILQNHVNLNSIKKKHEFDDTLKFINKVMLQCQDSSAYNSFLTILNEYQNKQKGVFQLYKEVTVLFAGYPNLYEEFLNYLPEIPYIE